MLGLLSGLGKGVLEGKYEQKLSQRRLHEEWQKKYKEQQLKDNELLPDEKEFIANVPRYQRAMDLAHEKLKAAEKTLPNSPFERLFYGDYINQVTDIFRDGSEVGARNEFARYLEGELLPAIMQIEGLPMNEYAVKSFKQKFNVNKLSAKSWKKFFDETSSKLESRALDIQKKIRNLNEIQLGNLIQDPKIQATMKEEVARKFDSHIEGLSNEDVNALIKLSGSPEMSNESPEIQKSFLRELGLNILFDVGISSMLGTAGFTVAGPPGAAAGVGLGALISAFAANYVERKIVDDPDAGSNAATETKENAPLILVSHGVGSLAAKGIGKVRGLFKQGREPVSNVVSRGFGTAVKDIPDIKVNDVGEFLSSTAKQTNNPFQRIVTRDLAKKFASKEGSYTSKEFAEILSGLRESSRKLAEKYGIPENQIRDIVSKLEERFLPLRANVSKTMGLLSGASSALEKGNVRKVAEIFSELPEQIIIDDGIFTKGQVIRHFLLENSSVIRNKYRKPIGSATEVMTFAKAIGKFSNLPMEALAKIGLNGITDPQIAKLFAKYAFDSSESEVIRQLQSALQGKIIEEQGGFIQEVLKKIAMSGSRVGLRGQVQWKRDD